MKKYIRKALLFSLLGLGTLSCSIDDIEPINQLTDLNVVRDETSARQVLNGVYSQWRQFNLGYFPILKAAQGNEGVLTGRLSGDLGYNINEVPVENPVLGTIYNSYYAIINQANFLIEQLEAGKAEGASEERVAEMISEARFNRALAYFELLRNFGEFYDLNSEYGVVIRTSFANVLEAEERSSVQEVYDQIFADLEYAIANGPVNVAHHFAGSLAAKALLAKVKLYAGAYPEAAALAGEVINNSEGYALEEQYSDIFLNQTASKEVIFAPFAGTGSEGGVAMYQVNRTSYSPQLELAADEQVETPGSLAGIGEGYDPRFLFAYAEAGLGNNLNGKYPYENSVNNRNNTNFHLRMGEMYLIFAEAEIRSNGDTDAALTALNTIRERAGVAPLELTDPQEILLEIREEKLLELFFENGEGWYDLVRYHVLGDINAFAIKETLHDEGQFVLPIPLNALTGNNQLKQNPYYL